MAGTRFGYALVGLMLLAVASGCDAGDGDTAPPTYPAGPYGFEVGDTIGDLRLVGSDSEEVALGAFHQGKAPALLLYVTATWCFTCGPEIGWLNDYALRVDGELMAMSVLLQNKQFEDATTADAMIFSDGYGAQFPTVIDPNGELDVYREQAFIPLNVLIDTETMRITLRETGFDQSLLEEAMTAIVEN